MSILPGNLKTGKTFNPFGVHHGPLIPSPIMKSKTLSDGAKNMFGVLSQIGGDNGKIFASYDYLAGRIGRSRSTAKRHCKELKSGKEPLLEIGVHGSGKTNSFTFLWRDWLDEDLRGKQVRSDPLVPSKQVKLDPLNRSTLTPQTGQICTAKQVRSDPQIKEENKGNESSKQKQKDTAAAFPFVFDVLKERFPTIEPQHKWLAAAQKLGASDGDLADQILESDFTHDNPVTQILKAFDSLKALDDICYVDTQTEESVGDKRLLWHQRIGDGRFCRNSGRRCKAELHVVTIDPSGVETLSCPICEPDKTKAGAAITLGKIESLMAEGYSLDEIRERLRKPGPVAVPPQAVLPQAVNA